MNPIQNMNHKRKYLLNNVIVSVREMDEKLYYEIDLDYDDVALDLKIGYSYLASVFESLYKEIFNNLNHFYFVQLDNKVE